MTENQPSVTAIAIKWGLVTGLIFVAYALFTFITESFGNFFISLFISTAIAIVGIVLAMRDYKKQNFGYMSYGQGLGLGIMVMIVASLISGVFSFFYTTYIDPTIPEKMVDAVIEQLSAFGIEEEAMEEARDKELADNTPLKQLTGALMNGIFSGLFLSLIISAIMKNKRPEFE